MNETAVTENFDGDEFFGADRKLDMKARMRASVNEVQKLSADAKKATSSAGGPIYRAAGNKGRFSRRDSRARSAAVGNRSFPPGFVKPAASVPGEQFGNKKDIVCFKCQ